MHDAMLLSEQELPTTSAKAAAAEPDSLKKIESVFVIAASEQSHCGVYDYTAKLVQAIRERGRSSILVSLNDWSLSTVLKLAARFRGRRDLALQVQYPSTSMGSSIFPALLPLLLYPAPVYLTLHEFSIFSLPRKLIFWSYAKFAKAILFSNDFERDAFASFYKGSSERLHVVPIGSNIDGPDSPVTPLDQRVAKLIYFGQISENKGIEIFLETVRKLRARKASFQAAIIGAVMDKDSALTKEIIQTAEANDIKLRFDLPSSEVGQELSSARLALLPFPDGISDKRGSALACLNFGTLVATRHSAKTPLWLRQTTLPIDDSETCAALAEDVLSNPGDVSVDWAIVGKELQRRRWPTIAQDHIDLYEQI